MTEFSNLSQEYISRAKGLKEFKLFSDLFDSIGVKTWLNAEEKAFYFGVGAFLDGKPRHVEIGTFEGGSALFTMAGMKYRGDGILYSIDPHLGAPPFFGTAPYQFTFSKFRKHVQRAGLEPFVKSMVTDGQTASAVWPSILLDSVLIDGDHSYLGALKDIECWSVKLRNGGLLIIDDVDDTALTELHILIEDIKCMKELIFDGNLGGTAIFKRNGTDGFALLEELKLLKNSKGHRPWDLSFVQNLTPNPEYHRQVISQSEDLHIPFQLGFLARCGDADYGITAKATKADNLIVDELIAARQDGEKLTIDTRNPKGRFRMIVCTVDEAISFKSLLVPGGVIIARSESPNTEANALVERKKLIDAGFEACGWSKSIHWGIADPHQLSSEAIMQYIERSMSKN